MTRAVFVFGSNLGGIHGAGSALEAHKYWGAEMGVGVGPTGNAYAIPTKDRSIMHTLPLRVIAMAVMDFVDYAREHTDVMFILTRIGCGLAGLTDDQVAPLFAGAIDLPNVLMCDGWREVITS